MTKPGWRYAAGAAAVLVVGGGSLLAAQARNPGDARERPRRNRARDRAAASGTAAGGGEHGPVMPGGGRPDPAGGRRGGEGGEDGARRTAGWDRMLAGSDLTPGQNQQAAEIRARLGAEQARIRASSTSDAEKREQLRAARQHARAEFQKILTPQQSQRLASASSPRSVDSGSGGERTVADGERRRRGGNAWMRESLAKLDLTTEQRQKLKAADQELQAVRARAAARGQEPTDASREQLRQATAHFRQQVQAILNPEQRKQLEAARPKPRREAGRPPAPGGDRPSGDRGENRGARHFGAAMAQATADLGLTAEQQRRLDAVLEKYRGEFDQLRTGLERSGGPSELRERSAPLREKMRAGLMQVLTPEQRQRFEQKLQENRDRQREQR
jgi:Spy/CpxP family protein refolding chaperone